MPFPEPAGPPTATVPPTQCPAHTGALGAQRIYGPEARKPHALYERLRKEHGQVAPVLLPGEVPAWFVLGHRENLEVMRTPSLWSCDSRIWNVQLTGDSPLLPITAWQPLLVFADGEEHARLRAAVTDSLARFNRHGVRRYVVRYTHQLVDGFAKAGRADLVSDFAEKLPILVLARQFGIAEEDALPLGAAVRDMVKGTPTALQSNTYVVGIMSELLKRKKGKPGDDLASWLLSHESGLTDDEVVEHLRHAIVAAHENTTNLVANTLKMVLTDRRFRASLSGGSMTLPDALEQVMWDAPPLAVGACRWARQDIRLGEQDIKAGDMVMLGLAAGNVDPEIRPDLTAPVHGNRAHLAFSSGPHECPGQDIGRAIADTGIDTLLARLPDVQLDDTGDEVQVTSSLVSSRLNNLPARFTPHSAGPRNHLLGEPAVAASAQPLPQATPAAEPVASVATSPGTRSSWWSGLFRRRTH
ncbi:cytochrome P450 [Streptomyces peucetius]|uniref:Cytochrome P450 n=1 Tax=Streptomyces peucetius TaxID=1950 RepID=A0ABY6IKD1_STRPE|nr:cytochrome P450 [Streptomyces peucetius]UYQ66352.1 cytochrome P450 [Streptomyces peucetius]